MNSKYSVWFYLSLALILLLSVNCLANKAGWESKKIDLRMSNGSRITKINYPAGSEPLIRVQKKQKHGKTLLSRKNIKDSLQTTSQKSQLLAEQAVFANIVESPPIDGFVPWVTIVTTDERLDILELDAIRSTSVQGDFFISQPEENYAIGIFDTGASTHILNNGAADKTGLLDADMLTSNTIEIKGVTGSIYAWVSQPYGLYIDGLGVIDPCGVISSFSNMVGEYNVSTSVGPSYAAALQTAIGSPLSAFFTTYIDNENQVTVISDGNEFTGPNLVFYDEDYTEYDPAVPHFDNIIPLELRPLGAAAIQYTPSLEDFDFPPAVPSIIIGNLAQSLFFVHSVDLYEGTYFALDKDRFMLDTGAQVSVIGSRIATRLHLEPNYPEFTVEILDVTGESTTANGYTIDSIQIPAFGDWFIANNVPAIHLDIDSPEGGTLDGIIGMNLFTEFNLIIRGGGIPPEIDPVLELDPIYRLAADIAPEGGDGIVNELDLQAFIDAWLSEGTIPPSAGWNPRADFFPLSSPDDKIDSRDFAVFAQYWLHTEQQ
jgi:predicted aspartyl protease